MTMQTQSGGGQVTPEGEIKESPFTILIGYTSKTPSPEDLARGAEIAKEFYDLQNTEDEMPACIESITIKRVK